MSVFNNGLSEMFSWSGFSFLIIYCQQFKILKSRMIQDFTFVPFIFKRTVAKIIEDKSSNVHLSMS